MSHIFNGISSHFVFLSHDYENTEREIRHVNPYSIQIITRLIHSEPDREQKERRRKKWGKDHTNYTLDAKDYDA